MIEHKHTTIRIIRNVISCIFYIIALSVVLVLYGIVEDKFRGHSPPLNDPAYWIEQFQNNVHSFIFYITCQFIAASLIIRDLSLKKLFVLTFIGIVISHWLEPVLPDTEFLFLSIFIVIVLSYVAPTLILFLINVKKTPSSESEAQMQEQAIDDIKNKYTKYWYVLDIFLIAFILFWGALSDPFGLISYLYGLKNDYMFMELAFGQYFLTVPAILCILVLIIRMIVSWPKYISGKGKLFSLIILVNICLFAYLTFPFLPIAPSPGRMYIAGFEGYVKKNADIDAIRMWLNSLNREDFREYERRTKERYKALEKQDRPAAVSYLKPRSAVLSWDGNYKPKVGLSWGSGVVGPWGFVVRSEDAPTPASELSYSGEYRHEIQDGVYAWRRHN